MIDIDDELVSAFRVAMPAFADEAKWPLSVTTSALYEADAETGGKRWGGFGADPRNLKRRGLFLFAAHWLAVTYSQGTAEDASAVSPSARLNVASKGVGDENVSYRVGAMQQTEEDWLSLTNYGVQFLRLRRRVGMGAMAL